MKSLLTWLLVIVPLSWGVTKSVQKSLPLFRGEVKPKESPLPVFLDRKAWLDSKSASPAPK